MNDCRTVKRVKTTVTCVGDRRNKVSIQTRDLQESGFEDDQPNLVFTTVRQKWCAIESVGFPNSGVARFDGVNIVEGTTHIFWCDWDPSFPDVEQNNHYLLDKDKRYRILKVDNVNERDETLAILVTERGEDEQEATEA